MRSTNDDLVIVTTLELKSGFIKDHIGFMIDSIALALALMRAPYDEKHSPLRIITPLQIQTLSDINYCCLDPEILSVALSPLMQCLTIQGCFCTSLSGILFSGSSTNS